MRGSAGWLLLALVAAGCSDDEADARSASREPDGSVAPDDAAAAAMLDPGPRWPDAAPSRCADGELVCSGRCVDPLSDPHHCGASVDCLGAHRGAVCSESQSCANGLCVLPCAPGEVACDGVCVDPEQAPCLRWTSPQQVDPWHAHEGDVEPVAVAVDAQGNAFALFERLSNESPSSLWVSRYDVERNAWSFGERLSALVEHASLGGADLGVDASGNALVVFSQQAANGRYELWSRRFDAREGQWQELQTAKQDPVSAEGPDLYVEPDGDAVVFWRRFDDIHATYWWNRYDAAVGQWGENASLDADGFAAAAADANGNVLVATTTWNADSQQVLAVKRYLAVEQAWQPAATIPLPDSSFVDRVQLAFDASGGAALLWSNDTSGADESLWLSYAPALGEWSEPERVALGVSFLDYAAVHFDRTGRLNLIYESFDPDASIAPVWWRWRETPSAAFSPPEAVVADQALDSLASTIDPEGRMLVVFGDLTPGPENAWARVYDPGSHGWRSPYLLETYTRGDARSTLLASGNGGHSCVLWLQLGTTSNTLWASVYR